MFQDHIGNPYHWDELSLVYEKAKLRFELEIPPGLRDRESKRDFRKYGDVVLWFQLIDYARAQRRPIIFVTDDGKDDWWKFEGNKPIGSRTELIQEMFNGAGVLLYMYQGYDFLETAAKILSLEEKPEVIEEAKEVSYQNEKTAEESTLYRAKSSIRGFLAETLIQRWLEHEFPLPDFQLYNSATGVTTQVSLTHGEADSRAG